MKKTTVWILELDGTRAIHFSFGCLIEQIKLQFEDNEHEDMNGEKYLIYTEEMTEEEIENLPEFDGF